MLTFIRKKGVEIGLTLLVSFVILFSSFYHGTQNDIKLLKSDNTEIHEIINNHELRLNQKDVKDAKMQKDIDYIVDMLEEIKEKIND